ncbi:ester cyclase [Hyalangium rubrum]|uniref:Ester cyclase n=1 Tax=Hyalangium rubrum TaxID=3103134 RepID=A0ABU5H483_9BACT|nr:ester cyclase [Hyalangium sp. s54d21]MDY7227904.1 ester cyclase [Hyalangium sp. s54d21]
MSESLPVTEKQMGGLWDNHLKAEFTHKSPEEALSTMTGNPHVVIVPNMTGGKGTEELGTFYAKYFLNQLPADMEILPLSRTIGRERVVDELVLRFTHDIRMDWVLPGVPPTGKKIEFAMVVIVTMQGDKIVSENLYWDNATILLQAGLLHDKKLPVVGAESARYMLNPTEPLNQLIHRTQR